MATSSTDSVSPLIALILERYHEPHRLDMQRLRDLAQSMNQALLEEEIAVLQERLELHMFKEEMRTFPMIEQGNSGLIGHLAEDMMQEHRRIETLAATIESRIARLTVPGKDEQVSFMRTIATRFFAELAEHARLEDECLFLPVLSSRTLVPIN